MQRQDRGEKPIARAKDYNTVWREVQRDIKDAERVLGYVQKGQFSISKPKSKTKKKSSTSYVKGFDPKKDYEFFNKVTRDATPWDRSFDLNYLFDCLKKLGVPVSSEEVMINMKTGTEMPCLIFNSVVYYQRLKHMVLDKHHARSRGPVHALHRQPAEGRKKGGGFRVGHMERNCLYGACISIH